MDCHDTDMNEGDIDFEKAPLNWQQSTTGEFWENVIAVLDTEYMPPAKKKKQPTTLERREMIRFVRQKMSKNVTIGGSGLRAFDRDQFQNTIKAIFGMNYQIPDYFPDSSSTSFPLREDLQLSGTLMQAYYDVALDIANKLLPPEQKKTQVKVETFTSKSHSQRLVNSRSYINRSLKTEQSFGARYSGEYALTVKARPFFTEKSFYPQAKNYILQIYTLRPSASVFKEVPQSSLRAEFVVKPNTDWQLFSKTIRVEEGETIAYRWKNGPIQSGPYKGRIKNEVMQKRFKEQRFWLAWKSLDKRGLTPKQLYQDIMQAYKEKRQPANSKKHKRPAKFGDVDHNYINDFLNAELTLHGPALDVLMVSVKGPLKIYKSKPLMDQEKASNKFLGERQGKTDEEYLKSILQPVIEKAFRQPVKSEMLNKYTSMAMKEIAQTGRFQDGVHLALRAVLASPKFLFRYSANTQLNNYDLANRLSYFLTRTLADSTLLKVAKSGSLLKREILKKEVERLLKTNKSQHFINHFVDKWLHIEKLDSLMPDPRLKRFTNKDLKSYKEEARLFFNEILQKNLPLETFIAPNFTFMNQQLAKTYGLKGKFDSKMKKVPLQKDGARGGLLTLPATMMATANGVDTQPVLRGVWLLENIMGVHLPKPPSSIPALEPDTSKAETVKQQLAAHKTDPSCASCHKLIDPVGFALENFDAVGQWRSHYPIFKEIGNNEGIKKRYKTINGQKVDVSGQMPDGVNIKDVIALKKYLVTNIDQFANCLSQKLMTAATGRKMNYAEKQEISRLVSSVLKSKGGFKDLLIALIDSKIFRTR